MSTNDRRGAKIVKRTAWFHAPMAVAILLTFIFVVFGIKQSSAAEIKPCSEAHEPPCMITDPEILRQWNEMHPDQSRQRKNQLIKRYEGCVVRLYDLAVRNGTAPSRRLRNAVEEECAIRHVEGARLARERASRK